MLHKSDHRRRIGLNAQLLSLTESYRGAGIHSHIYQLLKHLPVTNGAAQAWQLIAYLSDPQFVPPPGLTVHRSGWNTASPWRRIAWEQTRLAQLSSRLDLLHGMAYALPLTATCPTVVTVHDLSFLRFPEAFRPWNRLYLSFITRASVRRAAAVIAVSESTRQDVRQLCGVAAEKITVVPNGVAAEFCPADDAPVADFRQRKGLPDRFILFLGTLEPRKNLLRLVEAYARLPQRAAVRLVIAGGKGWFYEQLFRRVAELGLAEQVLFPGFLPAAELPWWYRAAELFVYPSRFEGFGMPVLEALACGTPTITTTASSLPEVAGDAALLVDPDDTEALIAAMGRVLDNAALAAQLREAGLHRASQLPWSRVAASTLEVYRTVLRGTL